MAISLAKLIVGNTHAPHKACERGYIFIVIFMHFRICKVFHFALDGISESYLYNIFIGSECWKFPQNLLQFI